ncbi:hypothetical protein N7535_008772 [Penicillium sp. DV-2018c]|nr:hypothetical protein N7461_002529 [Penicillium sp. DV-2018c]KAJ5563608.1 hypothetical protein N7535_008772 [Penicillium sp. DV-2018c]
MADDSTITSPEKLSPQPEGESFLSQPVNNIYKYPDKLLSPMLTPYLQNSDAQGQLAAAVDDLLNELQSKFDSVSTEIFGKLDEMTKRLDELEASLATSSGSATPTSST